MGLPSAIKLVKTYHDLPLSSKRWLIVGKGPSFDLDKISKFDGNIIYINETINKAPPGNNFCIFNDLKTIDKIGNDDVEAFFMPSSLCPVDDQCAVDWLFRMYMCACSCGSIGNRVFSKGHFFDLKGRYRTARLLPDDSEIYAFNSTYESAIWILAYAGVKSVYTCGIDFSSQYHPLFDEGQSCTFAAMKYYAQVAIDAFQMNVRPLEG